MKTKRRKVLGASSADALNVLDELSLRIFDKRVSNTILPSPYICYKCKRKAEEYQNTLLNLRKTEKDFITLLERLLKTSQKRCHSFIHEEVNSTESSSESIIPPLSKTPKQTNDSNVTVRITYPSGPKSFAITPTRQDDVKRLARRSFTALSSSIVSSTPTSDIVIKDLAKHIKEEMKSICSDSSNSIIRDTNEGIKCFKWNTLFHELSQKLPTLVKLLSFLISGQDNSKRIMLVSFIASIILKNRFNNMALLQRAISVVLYGNGCSREVFGCLQPLMVCLSHVGTLKLIDRISEDHDGAVHFWSHDLITNLKNKQTQTQVHFRQTNTNDLEEDLENAVDFSIGNTECCLESKQDNEEMSGYTELEDCEQDEQDEADDEEQEECPEVNEEAMEEVYGEPPDTIEQPENDGINSAWTGFKIVGDNLDKNFRRTYQRLDFQTVSHHYFHMYAVRDRVDLSSYSDIPKDGIIDITQLLPTYSDHSEMQNNFSVLLSRVLVQHLPQFAADSKSVEWHISHKFSNEMKRKSVIVPLGIEFKNENKIDEMTAILDNLHQYVPSMQVISTVTLPSGQPYESHDYDLWQTLLGEDQLTAARIRGAQDIRDDHDTSIEKLKGFIPVVEDWHSRMTLLKVIWGRLFSTSATDKGTLFQMKNILNRSSVPKDPKDNVQATEDFLEVVLVAHIVAAAKEEYVQGMSLQHICQILIQKFVHLTEPNIPTCSTSAQPKPEIDQVHVYACELLTLGLIWMNYYDAIKEGDGERVMRIWKYLMLLFRATGHRNYAKEAALLLMSYHCTSSERVAAQMMTSRFVNTKGRIGCNLPCDLHLEHLNRRLKGIITKMESNIKPKSIIRAAKAIGVVESICKLFSDEMKRTEESGKHTKPSYVKDLNCILSVLKESNVFAVVPKRRHLKFSFAQCLLESVKEENVTQWLLDNIVPCFI